MAENSLIGWTDHTWNPWIGCRHVSKACRFCYIGPIIRRMGKEPFDGAFLTKTWPDPYRFNRQAQALGRRYRVFTCSMSDFFIEDADEWRPEAWETIKECKSLDFQVLTKRPENIHDRLPSDWGDGYPNVWLGVTVEAEAYLERVESLAKIPAVVHWVSAEPLYEAINFRPYLRRGWIDWIITGCENAHRDKRAAMDMDWVRDIHRQCEEYGAAHFLKQYYGGRYGNTLIDDGMLDGRKRQELPVLSA